MDEAVSRAFEQALAGGAYSAAWRYACRLTASPDAAQDLMQDSLAHALPRFAKLRDPAAFKAWLLAIVRTQFLLAVRMRKLEVPLEAELAGQLQTEHGPEEQLVLEMLRSLPPAQRELLELFYIEGLTLAELGSVLRVPAIAARHRLHRAREALRREVERLSSPARPKGANQEANRG